MQKLERKMQLASKNKSSVNNGSCKLFRSQLSKPPQGYRQGCSVMRNAELLHTATLRSVFEGRAEPNTVQQFVP